MPPATRPRVLVADDQSLIRWAVGRTLEHMGFDIVYAATHKETEERLRDATFDVVIMASPFEDHDERELLGRIEQSGTRLLILSDVDAAPTLRAELPGAVVLEKPFSVLALVSALQGSDAEAGAAPGRPRLMGTQPLEGS